MKAYDCLQTQKQGILSLTFALRKLSRPKKKLSRKLWESSRPFQRSSVGHSTSWPLYSSDLQPAAQEAKLATAQNALGGIKGRLREIMKQQEIIALERGQIALDYAVRVPDYPYENNIDRMPRMLSRQSESPTTISTKPRSCS